MTKLVKILAIDGGKIRKIIHAIVLNNWKNASQLILADDN
jgi:hypothetical protein